MGMRAALLVLFFLPPLDPGAARVALARGKQEDPFKTLADPARRADEKSRRAAAQALADRAKESPLACVGARFLEKADKEWKLGADPATGDFQAYLAKYAAATLTDARHREGLQALVAALEKHAKSEAHEVLRLFAYAHVSVLGDKAGDFMTKLGLAKEGDRWGRKEHLTHYAVARVIQKPAYLPAEAERAARGSPAFAPRYAVALIDVQKAFSVYAGYEPLYKSLSSLTGTGAPRGAAPHVKALAESVRAAVFCSNACKNGKVNCEACLGKKRRDVICDNCKGLGWAQKGGATANTLIRCWRCPGTGLFKNAGCPTCKGTGLLDCALCGGKPWRDGFKGCKDCKVCSACKGMRVSETICGTCGGKSRVPPVVAGIPTTLCGTCRGESVIRKLCADCKESGLADCAACGKGHRDGKSPARPRVADVYATEPCAACAGTGWPLPNVALPCDRCCGVGSRIIPKFDPSKVLE